MPIYLCVVTNVFTRIQKRGIVIKITPARYVRKPFYVDAIEVTAENLDAVAVWCSGTVVRSVKGEEVPPYIQVQVLRPLNERQTKAYPGDVVLMAGNSFKVYTNKAFRQGFDAVVPVADENQPTDEMIEFFKKSEEEGKIIRVELDPLGTSGEILEVSSNID
jgi:hypothetical protein